MRLALLLAFCLGCSGSSGREPKWPKLTEKEVDGGESLAPHTATTVAADRSDDASDTRPDTPSRPTVDRPATSDAPASTPSQPASSSTPDDPIQTEDIIIEIDD